MQQLKTILENVDEQYSDYCQEIIDNDEEASREYVIKKLKAKLEKENICPECFNDLTEVKQDAEFYSKVCNSCDFEVTYKY